MGGVISAPTESVLGFYSSITRSITGEERQKSAMAHLPYGVEADIDRSAERAEEERQRALMAEEEARRAEKAAEERRLREEAEQRDREKAMAAMIRAEVRRRDEERLQQHLGRSKLSLLNQEIPKWFDEDYKIKVVTRRIQLSRAMCTYHIRRPKVKPEEEKKEDDEDGEGADGANPAAPRKPKTQQQPPAKKEITLDDVSDVSSSDDDEQPPAKPNAATADTKSATQAMAEAELARGASGGEASEEKAALARAASAASLAISLFPEEEAKAKAKESKEVRRARRRLEKLKKRADEEAAAANQRRNKAVSGRSEKVFQEFLTVDLQLRDRLRFRENTDLDEAFESDEWSDGEERAAHERKVKERRDSQAAIKQVQAETGVQVSADGQAVPAAGEESKSEREKSKKSKKSKKEKEKDKDKDAARVDAMLAKDRADAAARAVQAAKDAKVAARMDREDARTLGPKEDDLVIEANEEDEQADGEGEGEGADDEKKKDPLAAEFESKFVKDAQLQTSNLPINTMLYPKEGLNLYEERRVLKNRPRDQDIVVPPPLPPAKPGSLDLVVLLHGLVDYSYQFHELGTALVKRGYTVLTFDFYGHGGTPWPEYDRYIVADLDLFLEQTEELLILLGYLTKDGDEILPNKTVRRDAFTFTVVGYDAGAVVAAALARLRPREVERLVLVSPLGVPGAFKCEDVMFKACRCVRTEKRVVQSARRYYADKRACDVFRQRQEEEIALQVQLTPGYLKCVYSMRANFPVHDALETYQAIGKDDRQVLIVWGDRDVICNVHKYELLMKLMPHASFYVCHGSGHNVMFEAHRKFVRKMVRFLRGEYETALARARKAATEVKEARRKLEEERKREEEERRRELEAATSLDRRAASTRLSKKKKQREEEAAAAKRREEEDKFKVIEADINRARAMYNMATHEILDLPEDEGPSSESEYEEVPEAEIARLERRIQDEEAEAERKRRIERLQEKRRNFGLKIDESRKLDVIDKEEEKRRAEEEELKRRETERDEAALQTEDIIGAVEGDDERDEDADIERKQQQRYEKAIEAAEAAAGYDSHELESNESELDEATRIKLVREELERRRELAAKRAESKTAVEVDQQVAAATAKPAEATGKRRRARRAGSSRMSSVSSLPSSTGEP